MHRDQGFKNICSKVTVVQFTALIVLLLLSMVQYILWDTHFMKVMHNHFVLVDDVKSNYMYGLREHSEVTHSFWMGICADNIFYIVSSQTFSL